MKTVIILGATVQVGQALLQLELALQHPEISRVVAPTRRSLPPQANLDNPLVDYEALPETATWGRPTWRSARCEVRYVRLNPGPASTASITTMSWPRPI